MALEKAIEEDSVVERPARPVDIPNEPGPSELLKGTLACSRRKSKKFQVLADNTCTTCGEPQDPQDPSSANNCTRRPFDQYRTIITTLDLDALITTDGSVSRRKILLLGDSSSGKTWLASHSAGVQVPAKGITLNNFVKEVAIEGQYLDLVISDANEMDEFERLRRSTYDDVHVVLLCFDICQSRSCERIGTRVSKSQ